MFRALVRFSTSDSQGALTASAFRRGINKPFGLHDDRLLLAMYLMTSGYGAAHQAAGLRTLAGTFDAGVRVDGIAEYGTTSLK